MRCTANLIDAFFQNEPDKLIQLCGHARSESFLILFRGALQNAQLTKDVALEWIKLSASDFGDMNWEERNAFFRRRAIAGLLLFAVGESSEAWPLLSYSEHPTTRALIIEWLPMVLRSPSVLLDPLRSRLEDRLKFIRSSGHRDNNPAIPNPWLFDSQTSQLRALLQIAGNIPSKSLQRFIEPVHVQLLADLVVIEPDSGAHALCRWLLRMTGNEEVLQKLDGKLNSARDSRAFWSRSENGHTMIHIHGPISFVAGAHEEDPYRVAGSFTDPVTGEFSSWSEDDRHNKCIPRSFAIAMHETSFQQVQTFDPRFHELHNKSIGPTLQHPACRISWDNAAVYCNWLSQREGIPPSEWCFEPNPTREDGMQLAPDYLMRLGYRLPTEAEWEYACRAGTISRRYFGETDELLSKSVFYESNSLENLLLVPGSLKPNELGLFETFGNVMEWCMDEFDVKKPAARMKELDIEAPIHANLSHIMRGGSIYSRASEIRASDYSNFLPTYRDGNTGFRIARTLENAP